MSYKSGDKFVTIDAWSSSGKHRCLWDIAADSTLPGYKKNNINGRVNELKKINNITNDKYVYAGQKIYLSASTQTTASGNSSNAPVIEHMGIQTGTERTIYVSWKWDQHSKTEKYEYEWYYDTEDAVTWFLGDSGDSGKQLHTTYTPPDNAKRVKFRVHPIAVSKEG